MKFKKTMIISLIIFSIIIFSSGNYQSIIRLSNAVNYESSWHHQLIYSETAWNITQGRKDIVVAVVDSGIDFSHPDLVNASNKWINTGEIASNGIDDDSNGFIDDTEGWDFHSNDNSPGPIVGDSVHLHATFIAGIIAAPKDDFGVVGVAPNITLMNVRILDSGNSFYSYDTLGNAIRYAADNGADVINLSLYAFDNSSLYMDDIAYAISLNIPVVAVTGNNYMPIVSYPAKSTSVIAVGASNQINLKADYSNYGEETELVAPVGDSDSVNIISIAPPDQYWTGWGTSFAAPQVAATIALMRTLNYSLSVNEIRNILHKTATDIEDEGFDIKTGYGLINVTKALEAVLDPSILFTTQLTNLSFIIVIPSVAILSIIVIKRKKKQSINILEL